MSVLPYHKRYHGDALTGFMPLTLEERGAYQTLLDMIYDRGGPLIDNERLLAGYMNCSVRKWRQLRAQLLEMGKIVINKDGMISNSRARKEIENQSKTHRKLIESGAKGGRTRAENEKNTNENSESDQASLKPASSLPQAIRARPEARSQIPEKKKEESLTLENVREQQREVPPPGITDAGSAFEYVVRAARWRPANDRQRLSAFRTVEAWLASGYSLELVLAGIEQAIARRPGTRTNSLNRFTATIAGMHADKPKLNGSGEHQQDAKALVHSVAANLSADKGR